MQGLVADLHLHSTASDGLLPPQEVISVAEANGIDVIALTDHDSFEGAQSLIEYAGKTKIIQGVELSIEGMKNLHLLAYGASSHTPLHQKVQELASFRVDRAAEMIRLLARQGMYLELSEVEADAVGTIGRPHIARCLVRKGYAASVPEVFERWLGDGKLCYVPGVRLSMREALLLLRESKFVPVLAHPYEVQCDMLNPLIKKWKGEGLMGVEVYHPSAISHGFYALHQIAAQYGLLVTGGSDFHQLTGTRHGAIGCMIPYWQNMQDDIERFSDVIQNFGS